LISAAAPPQTALGELTTLPRPVAGFKGRERREKGKRKGKGRERGEEGRPRPGLEK